MKPSLDTSYFKVTWVFALVMVVLFALHQDFWLRDSSVLVAGLPIDLFYHLGYCLLVSLVLAVFFRKSKR